MTTRLARRVNFQCMHRYEVAAWSGAQNVATFGPCFTPTGHGHNYELEAYFSGPVDSTTGMIVNLSDVDQWLKNTVSLVADKHLNLEVPEFKNAVPTTEALAGFLFQKLNEIEKPLDVRLDKIRLFENEDLWVDVWP